MPVYQDFTIECVTRDGAVLRKNGSGTFQDAFQALATILEGNGKGSYISGRILDSTGKVIHTHNVAAGEQYRMRRKGVT